MNHIGRAKECEADRRIRREAWAGKSDFQGRRIGKISNQSIGDGEGGCIGGTSDRKAQRSRSGPATVHDES